MPIPNSIIEFFQEFITLHPLSLLSLLLFLIFIYKRISPNPITKIKNAPPSPPKLPIIGNLHQLGTFPYRTLRTLSQKYGDLVLLHLGSKPAIVVSSAELVSQVLKTHDLIFASRPNLSVFRRLPGNDILSSSYGEYWRQLRSICVLQLLSSKWVWSFRSVREEEMVLMMKNIRGSPIVNLTETFISLSTDVICRIALGKRYGEVKGGMDFYKLVNQLSKLLGGYYIGDFIPWLAWIDWISGVDAKVSKVNRGFDDFFTRIIDEHSSRRGERNEDAEENEMVIRDFVDVLLDAQVDDGSGNFCLENESIKAVILGSFWDEVWRRENWHCSFSRDPTYWEEPESFYPERFLNSPMDFKGQDFQFIPFGSGRRMRSGMAYATTNIELVLANLIHQFDWALPNGVDGDCLDMREAPSLAVHKKTPLLATPTLRI